MEKNKPRLVLMLILMILILSVIIPTSFTLGKYVLLSSNQIKVEVPDLTLVNYVYVSGEEIYNGVEIIERDGTSPSKPLKNLEEAYAFIKNSVDNNVAPASDGTYYIILTGNVNQKGITIEETIPSYFNFPATITAFVDNAQGFTNNKIIRTDFQSELFFDSSVCQYAKTVFKNITINSENEFDFFANGYSLVLDNCNKNKSSLMNIYGGNEKKNIEDINISVKNSTLNSLFGGGKDKTCDVNGNVNISIENSAVIKSLFGAGKESNIKGDINIRVNASSIYNIFGGSEISGNVSGNVNIDIYGGSEIESDVYGGSAGSGKVEGVINLNINGAVIENNIYGGGAGSGSMGEVVLNITDTEANYICGGGTGTGAVQNAVLNIYSGTKVKYIIGGGFSNSSNSEYGKVLNNSIINFYGGTVSRIYAGGYSMKKRTARVLGEAHVHLYSSEGISTSRILKGNCQFSPYFKDITGKVRMPKGFKKCYD